ncbi:[methyl-Co(III) methanol-specific corrinoid protein]:coenzyme M methyltransferase [Desulfosalsimonas propionicica]|uniref:[methyl-Co(III) methanol-specific corrinoid protein]:coenzyme M methyltransferase n=1 Tax=Desulfosalsimonas propionicica TaxID=332175 RepID=A0A7W0CBR1_9BACT|nr:MtaA/CmuA family methyltransferase [Desulfosalsimonas propionicica]MBA2882810.1 [methyl-Co(III) methanol-specific corrinoid protein]:coenzyme M methyltransferase [Desulfosalsimonas propionicica]
MNRKERFMRQLEGKSVDMTPVGSTTTYGVVDIMKKCGAERPLADTDPQAMATLALGGVEYAGFEWVKAMGWDITPLSEAFGCELGEAKIDRQHSIASHPFAESIEDLEKPKDLLQRGRFPAYKEQFKILKDKVDDEMVIFGESEGPFTCGANLVGTESFMKWTFKKPNQVDQVLSVVKEGMIEVINFAFDHGADYYVIAEPTSGPALMSPKSWKKHVQPVITEIVQKIKGPLVLHICGNTDSIIEMMCETGVAGISIEEKVDLKRTVGIAEKMGVKVFGNVGTAQTLYSGTPEQAYQESIAALDNGTHFLCAACGIAPLSPLENVQQLRKARDDYFKKG